MSTPYTMEVGLLEGIGDSELVDYLAEALYDRTDVLNATIFLDETTGTITIGFDIPVLDPEEASRVGFAALGETLAAGARSYVAAAIAAGRSWPAVLTPPELATEATLAEAANEAATVSAALRESFANVAGVTVQSVHLEREKVPA